MPRCACCNHPDLVAIDAAIVGGTSIYKVAERYGMSHMSVKRHKADHISAALCALKAAERDENERVTALDRVERLIARMERQLDAAEKAGQAGIALAAGAQIRANIELLAKLTHELDNRPQVTINLMASEEYLAVRAAIFAALQAHPEARTAVAGRLLALEAGPS